MMIYLCHKNRRKLFLLCGKCFLTFFFSAAYTACGQNNISTTTENIGFQQKENETVTCLRVVFWNVENLFDTHDDSCKNDDTFTPRGENHWTEQRYRKKLTNLCRVMAAMGEQNDGRFVMPQLIGLAEVENDKVLRDLCMGTPLRQYGYKFIHFDSPDARGIDNALLYRTDFFHPFFSQAIEVGDSSLELTTRDILLVEGTTLEGDTLIVVVNHFPSKLGGDATNIKREHVAMRLRYTMDTLQHRHPNAAIVIMGDFNAGPDEPEITNVLMRNVNFVNLMSMMESGTGSHNYKGQWTYLDQIIVTRSMMDGNNKLQVKGSQARSFAPDFMLTDDERNLGKKPYRTYQSIKYLGGYSDHLPVYIDLVRDKQ